MAALPRRRNESIEAAGKHFEAQGNGRYVQPGRWFNLIGHYQSSGEGNNQFVIIKARHSASNNCETNGKVPPVYTNTLSCLRKKIPLAPGAGPKQQ